MPGPSIPSRAAGLGLLAACVLLAVSADCSPPEPKEPAASGPPARPAGRAAFSGARAWSHLENQVRFGPRAPGLPGYYKVQDYLRAYLRSCGAEVRDIPFTHQAAHDEEPREFTNITARIGDGPRWVVIGSHYDTRLWADHDPDPSRRDRPILGANDGGSGVAVLLETARLLQEEPLPLGVEIILFDGEDYGREGSQDYYLGSKHIAEHWDELYPGQRPYAAIIIDMVGDADLGFHREMMSQRTNSWLNDILWDSGRDLGYAVFEAGPTISVLDDHAPLLGIGIPAVLLIDFQYPWWHTVEDTLDKCSPESLEITGRTLREALKRISRRAPREPTER